MTTIHVAIGNSDDRLTQAEWAAFHLHVDQIIRNAATAVYGAWVSPSTDPWQNACWAFSLPEDPEVRADVRFALALQAKRWKQDSVAWCVGETEFLSPLALP